jgi:hypothetical protein
VNVDGQRDPSGFAAARSHARGAIYARFREWRAHTLPDASYQLGPAFWTVAGLKYAATVDPIIVASVKRREPQLTGLAYTTRAIYLVVVAGAVTYEHVARLIHCRALMRDDRDYEEHRGKSVKMVMLCDDCPPAVADFARRYHVRVIGQPVPKPAPAPADGYRRASLNVTKPLSP